MRGYERISVTYKGRTLAITTLAKELGLHPSGLRDYYIKTGNIETAIEEMRMNSLTIIHVENVPLIGNDIDRETFIKKRREQRRKKIAKKKIDVDLYDVSLEIGIKYSDLLNLLGKGITLDEIKTRYVNHQTGILRMRDVRRCENGSNLLSFCIKRGLPYSYIYIVMDEYGKTLGEAIEMNKEGSIPIQCIYERYGAILRHLMINHDIDLSEIIMSLITGRITIQDVLEKYIIRKNAKARNMDEEWIEELYGLIKTDVLTEDEIKSFKKNLEVNESEEQCIEQIGKEVDSVKRKIALSQFYGILREGDYPEEKMAEMLRRFRVTPEEIDTVFVDLFFVHDESLLNDPDRLQRMEIIKELGKKWSVLTGEQRGRAAIEYKISPSEKIKMENISRRIIRFKTLLNQQTKAKPTGRG